MGAFAESAQEEERWGQGENRADNRPDINVVGVPHASLVSASTVPRKM